MFTILYGDCKAIRKAILTHYYTIVNGEFLHAHFPFCSCLNFLATFPFC